MEPAPGGTPYGPQAAPSASTPPAVAIPAAWAKPHLLAAQGWVPRGGGDPFRGTFNPPACAPWLLQVDTQMLGH